VENTAMFLFEVLRKVKTASWGREKFQSRNLFVTTGEIRDILQSMKQYILRSDHRRKYKGKHSDVFI
jgi:hypothetical protein